MNQKFDLICLFDVLEHIEEDVKTLVTAKGLLAKGGRILVTVPAYRWLWGAHDVFLHHKRRYSITELCKKVAVSGLRPVKISYFNTFLFPLAVIVRMKDRLFGNSSASGSNVPPEFINHFFTTLFSAEMVLLSKMNLPFGVSLLAVLQTETCLC
jgi:hypothetical protein